MISRKLHKSRKDSPGVIVLVMLFNDVVRSSVVTSKNENSVAEVEDEVVTVAVSRGR